METTEAPPEPPPVPLGAEEVKARLKQLPGWQLRPAGKAIWRRCTSSTPMHAVLVAAIFAITGEMRHHSVDIRLHNNRLYLLLTTPGAGGVTEEDLDLAWVVNLLI